MEHRVRPPDAANTTCNVCNQSMRSTNLQRHLKTHKKPCRVCNKMKTTLQKRNKHEKKCRRKIHATSFENDFQTSHACEKAINKRFMIFSIAPINGAVDYERSVSQNYDVIKQTLTELLRHYSALKFYTKFEALFQKDIEGHTKEFGFYSATTTLLQSSNIEDLLKTCELKTNNTIDKFISHGSGWIFNEFTNISLHVTEYRPCAGGSYLPLPQPLKTKRTLLNIRNKDDRCILYCLAAELFPADINQNSSQPGTYHKYIDENKIKHDKVNFPTPVSDIPKLEKLNNVRINVYGFDWDPENLEDRALNTGIFPLYISKFSYEKTISLLLLAHGHTRHYVLIRSIDALVKTKTKYGKTKHCERCLQGFKKTENLEEHLDVCKNFKIQRTLMPTDTHIKFKNVRKQLQFPVVISAGKSLNQIFLILKVIIIGTPMIQNVTCSNLN